MEHSRAETKPLGLVWLDCPDSLLASGLKETLRQHALVCCSTKAPVGLRPSLIIVPAEREDGAAEEVSRVKEMSPETPVVLLGLRADLALARVAMSSGAKGFVHAGMPPEQIVRALTVVQKGEVAVPRELVSGLLAQEEEAAAELLPLTPRQEEILGLVAEGLTNAQIAGELYLSEFTIKQHLRAAYKTLGVKNRTQAVRRTGLKR